MGINDHLHTYRSAFRSSTRPETGDFRYDDYTEFDGLVIPTSIKAEIKLKEGLSTLEMHYTDVDTATITSFAFNIPSSYQRIK